MVFLRGTTRSPRQDDVQPHADANRAVGDVERRPVVLPDVEVEKVDHRADADAVDQIADDSARNQPERQARARAVQREGMTEQNQSTSTVNSETAVSSRL